MQNGASRRFRPLRGSQRQQTLNSGSYFHLPVVMISSNERPWSRESFMPQPTPQEMGQYAASFWKGYRMGFLAALLDGEGTITVHNLHNVELGISNTNRELLLKAQRLIGGHVRISKKMPKGCKPVYTLRLCRMKEVYRVLREMQPFLTAKRVQCGEVLKFLHSRIVRQEWRLKNCTRDTQGRIFGTPKNPLTESERNALITIKQANLRGSCP